MLCAPFTPSEMDEDAVQAKERFADASKTVQRPDLLLISAESGQVSLLENIHLNAQGSTPWGSSGRSAAVLISNFSFLALFLLIISHVLSLVIAGAFPVLICRSGRGLKLHVWGVSFTFHLGNSLQCPVVFLQFFNLDHLGTPPWVETIHSMVYRFTFCGGVSHACKHNV